MKIEDQPGYEELNNMANSLSYSRERSLLREKAIDIADAMQDEEKRFEARLNYVQDVCMEGSFPEKYLTIFPWLLSYIDKTKDSYDRLRVLWYYKWVINIMPDFPQITKQQIENALHDLKNKYNEYGSSDKVYHDYSREAYLWLGDYELSAIHHKNHLRFKRRDDLDDCEACVLNRVIYFYIKTGDLHKALLKAEPILKGKLKCTHVPKDMYANFILPLISLGEYLKAEDFAEKLDKILMRLKYGGNYKTSFPLIIFYAINNNEARALKLTEKYFPLAVSAKEMNGKFYFYLAALYLFNNIKPQDLRLKLPGDFTHYNKNNIYNTSLLSAWLSSETDNIAAMFDKRNGNTKYQKDKIEILAYKKPG